MGLKSIEKFNFYTYNNNSQLNEIIATLYYELPDKQYIINIEAVVVDESKCKIKYICNYCHKNKKYNCNIFDSYQGNDEQIIKKAMYYCAELCYNRHRKGRNIKFNI